jgi:hypothetical protein
MSSENEVCQAVLGFVTEGAYPEEKLVAAEFPATALAKELELIAQAREQVEVSGCQCDLVSDSLIFRFYNNC